MRTIKVKYLNKIPKNYTGIIENASGNKIWLLNGLRHREDGPAVEWGYNIVEYWLNGRSLSIKKIRQLIKLGYPESTAIKLSSL